MPANPAPASSATAEESSDADSPRVRGWARTVTPPERRARAATSAGVTRALGT